MNASVTAALGIAFLTLSCVTTYLMFQFWGYPYDKERRKSACPQWKMNIHRAFGYAYAIIYVVMMTEMVPRLWQYQIEFPARTVAHIMLGLTIGVILIVKISILRWFRHFEEWMPALGVGLLLCTVLLSGLSLPFAVRERTLVGGGVGGHAFSTENQARVRKLLAGAGLADETDIAALSTHASLQAGREVLLGKCTYCHDLKTAIDRPRTPEDWVRTVERMRAKPTLGAALSQTEANRVAAYLIAITPDLQNSMQAKRADERERETAKQAVAEATSRPATATATPAASATDPVKAKQAYETVCSQCHELSDVDADPPKTEQAVTELMARMVDNGMEADEPTAALIRWYLVETFAKK